MKKIVLLLNGPNLNLLGIREPQIYGNTTLKEIENDIVQLLTKHNLDLIAHQTNHEGVMLDFIIQHREAAYTIINPGAWSHTSIALRDTLAAVAVPFVEVHISNVYKRENFRHYSYLSSKAEGVITGLGIHGYTSAAMFVIQQLKKGI